MHSVVYIQSLKLHTSNMFHAFIPNNESITQTGNMQAFDYIHTHTAIVFSIFKAACFLQRNRNFKRGRTRPFK